MSLLPPKTLPAILSHVSRVTNGYGVFGFFSQNAHIRPNCPKQLTYRDRQLVGSGVIATTYTVMEIENLMSQSGLEILAMQGMNIKGGEKRIHAEFILRQRKLQQSAAQGRNVASEFRNLRREIDKTIQKDLELGYYSPQMGHDIVVVARSS